jgi:hypothetical protein
MSYRKKELIKLANVLLEQRYLIEQTAPAPAPPAPAPAPAPAPPAPAPAPTTTTTTTIKIEKDELEVIVDCSSGKFNVDEKTWVKTEVGGYTVYTDPNPPKPGTTQLRCKKEK